MRVKGDTNKRMGANGQYSAEIFKMEYGDKISEISMKAFEDMQNLLKTEGRWAAKERFKAIGLEEGGLVAEQAMAKILCELYTRKDGNNNWRGNKFILSNYIDDARGFISEVHSLYKHFKFKNSSKTPTLGNKAKIILSGLEDDTETESER